MKPYTCMNINITPHHRIIFDLDDTLYDERSYLESGFLSVAQAIDQNIQAHFVFLMNAYEQKQDAFAELIKTFSIKQSKTDLIDIYRRHTPNIHLRPNVKKMLDELKANAIFMGLMTDGRSTTQRLKLKALGIENYFNEMLISEEFGSEKPCIDNYKAFMGNESFPCVFIADNPKKDFVSANALNWQTIGILDNGRHIHKQDKTLDHNYQPKYWIEQFSDLTLKYEQ
jgi:putative hydrolase of the HAD superfamily